MGKRDPRVDAYIAKSADFARPILVHLRTIVHAACPDVEETIKWQFATFMYKGMLCSMAAFKQHVTFGFWKAALMASGPVANEKAMGQFGRITAVSDLPSKAVITRYIKEAMRLNDEGISARRVPRVPRAAPVTPPDLLAALKTNRAAMATWTAFSPSMQREYVTWITEAKTEATRLRRVTSAIEWIASGKQRNWKYMDC